MKKFAVTALLCTTLLTLLLTYTGAAAPPAGDAPGPQTPPAAQGDPGAQKAAYAREWAEIKQKYPRFAAEHLMMREALAEVSHLRFVAKLPASATAGFTVALRDLCLDAERMRWVVCQDDKVRVDKVKPKCQRCGACRVAGLDVDCTSCLEKNAEAGCL